MSEKYRSIVYGGVWNSTYEDPQVGGPSCAQQTAITFKMGLNILLIPYYIYVFKIGYQILKTKINMNKIQNPYPTAIEFFIGVLSFLTFLSQIYFKGANYSLIYMMNPCHILLVVNTIDTPSCQGQQNNQFTIHFEHRNDILPVTQLTIALIFLQTQGLNIFFEFEMFFIQHILAAIINPIILAKSERYVSSEFKSMTVWLFGFSIFTLFQRVILTSLSHATWTNLNHSLCSTQGKRFSFIKIQIKSGDPFVPYFGKFYYLAAEVYLAIPSLIMSRFYIFNFGNFKKDENKINEKKL